MQNDTSNGTGLASNIQDNSPLGKVIVTEISQSNEKACNTATYVDTYSKSTRKG